MTNKKIFLVVGMHRSGTSVLANCASSLGLRLSDDLVKASSDNIDGFFEDQKIVDLNSEIEKKLDRGHLDSSGILPMPKDWVNNAAIADLAKQLKSYLQSCVDQYDNFLLKDPRLCRLLPLYVQIFDDLGISPVIIYVYRHPASVVRSKSSRDKLSEIFVETHWQLSNTEALREVFQLKLNAYFVSYDSFLQDPSKCLQGISKFLSENGVAVQQQPMPEVRNDGYLENLKKDISAVSIQKFSTELYDFMQAMSGNSVEQFADLQKDYSKLSRQFKDKVVVAHPWVMQIHENAQAMNDSQAAEREVNRLKAALKTTNGKSFGLNTRLTKAEETIGTLRSTTNELKGSEKKLTTKLVKLEGEYAGKVKLLNDTSTQLEETQSNYKNLQGNYKDLEASNSVLETDFRRLSLRQRTKIFRVADKLQNFKDQLFNYKSYLKQFLSKLKNTLYRFRSLSEKFARSVHNRGLLNTVKLSGGFVKKRLSGNSGAYKYSQPKLDVTLDQQVEAQYGPINWSALNLTQSQAKLVRNLFVKEYYNSVAGLDENTNDQDALSHFINIGFAKGFSPGPMFDAQTYIDRSSNQDIKHADAFKHWLNYGVSNRIVPTVLFDQRFYLARHSLVLADSEWSFERFISTTVHNNGTPNQYFEPNWYVQNHDLDEQTLPLFYHYLLVGSKLAWRPSPLFPCFSRSSCEQMEISPMQQVMSQVNFFELGERLNGSQVLREQIDKAAKIESKINTPKGNRRINVLPYSNPLFPAVKDIRQALPHSTYENIVLIPHCRYGGAGLVAGELCRSLLRLKSKKVLLVRTDHDDFMRPDWFPDSIDILNLRDFACDLPDVHRKKLLLDILIGLKPSRIYNVHSRLGWEVFVEFGDRLKKWSSLYGYTFCHDVNALGKKVGYPIKYVPDAIENLDRLLLDNAFLKDDLIKINSQWGQSEKDKLSVIWTPALNTDETAKVVFKSNNEKTDSRKKIFWAGRFDRQKRFDIVVKLAKQNPQLDFLVWGAAMLGEEDVTKNIPTNIQLNGLFESYSEIPFAECDVWLYTSQWDGVPTILIELGLRAIPLVASKVWGTADLISDATAYAVDDVLNVDAYRSAIFEALENPQEKYQRADKLRALILKQHSRTTYDNTLTQCIEMDDGSRA